MNKHIKYLLETLFDDDVFNDDNDVLSELNVAEKLNCINYIDLGLPSGNLWCDRNLGAKSETDYGLYFAWGETKGYLETDNHCFNDNNYKFFDRKNTFGTDKIIKKYCSIHNKDLLKRGLDNTIDKLKRLELKDDAAYKITNKESTIPTILDFLELISKCNFNLIENYRGTEINGYLITSRVNDNSIFLPFAGSLLNESMYGKNLFGEYWSNELTKRFNDRAIKFTINSNGYYHIDNKYVYSDNRSSGLTIRSVLYTRK